MGTKQHRAANARKRAKRLATFEERRDELLASMGFTKHVLCTVRQAAAHSPQDGLPPKMDSQYWTTEKGSANMVASAAATTTPFQRE